MSGIVEFLRARLDEDKQLALAVAGTGDMWWVTRLHVSQDLDPVRTHCQDRERTTLARCFDSARVLREVAAMRHILDAISPPDPHEPGGCPDCDVIYALATIYIDYPGYRQEWTP